MALSLYQASVVPFLQTLGAVEKFLAKGLAHFGEHGVDPNEIVETRLIPDMLPLRFQIISVAHHSRGALAAIENGVFEPPHGAAQYDYAGLQKLVTHAIAALSGLTPDAVNELEGREVVLQLKERKIAFTTEGFLQSFSLPNFYFHAATTYDILRMKGVPLGKRDFLGRLQLKGQ